jgi:hypothetical protein
MEYSSSTQGPSLCFPRSNIQSIRNLAHLYPIYAIYLIKTLTAWPAEDLCPSIYIMARALVALLLAISASNSLLCRHHSVWAKLVFLMIHGHMAVCIFFPDRLAINFPPSKPGSRPGAATFAKAGSITTCDSEFLLLRSKYPRGCIRY